MVQKRTERVKFSDLVDHVYSPKPWAPANARLAAIEDVRAELAVLESEVRRGSFEDETIAREALARAVATLIDVDRCFYRADSPGRLYERVRPMRRTQEE